MRDGEKRGVYEVRGVVDEMFRWTVLGLLHAHVYMPS
jgi:hypothetical protein